MLKSASPQGAAIVEILKVKDIGFVNIFSNTQGRLGTHVFDLVLPPLGITYLSAVLEREGYGVEIVDGNAELLSDTELLQRITGRFRIVGFYCHTQNYNKLLELCRILKKQDNPPLILIGGPHPTALPVECLETGEAIDVAVFGEAELTIVELVAKLLAGESLLGVKGVAYRDEDGRVVQNAPREYVEDLDSLPMPAWHLLPIEKYHNFIEASGRSVLQIMGSRGCPIDCNYCFSTKIWSSNVRWHSPERVLAEVDYLRTRYGIQFFEFLDDNFTLRRERFKFLAAEFRKRRLRWCCSTRIDLIDDEIAAQLRDARVDHVCIGIETVNERLLDVVGKKITKAEAIRTVLLCEKYGIQILGMFILGIPTETDEEAMETIEFALKYRFYFAVFSHLTIYPGTNFWNKYRGSKELATDFTQYDFSKRFNYFEPGRDLGRMYAMMKMAYLRFYTKPRILVYLVGLMLRNPKQLFQVAVALLMVLLNIVLRRRAPEPVGEGLPPAPILAVTGGSCGDVAQPTCKNAAHDDGGAPRSVPSGARTTGTE
jgi:radical SAM superfamily enzyme YgiQ (UPF0313 family)